MSTVFEASYTELKKMEAEIERLRAALKAIADDADTDPLVAAYAREAIRNGQLGDKT